MWGDGERREREGGKERGGVMGRGEGEGRRGGGGGRDGEGRGRGPRFSWLVTMVMSIAWSLGRLCSLLQLVYAIVTYCYHRWTQ